MTPRILAGCILSLALHSGLQADEPAKKAPDNKPADQAEATSTTDAEQQERFRAFEKRFSGLKLVGQFTVDGRDNGPAAKEEYTINKVSKMPQGDYWLFHARIKYGEHDVTVPIPLEVKWAGKTPVLTLDNLTIPGLGTFSSRVVIDQDKYAGTWSHGPAGGHLFGTLVPVEKDTNPKE